MDRTLTPQSATSRRARPERRSRAVWPARASLLQKWSRQRQYNDAESRAYHQRTLTQRQRCYVGIEFDGSSGSDLLRLGLRDNVGGLGNGPILEEVESSPEGSDVEVRQRAV